MSKPREIPETLLLAAARAYRRLSSSFGTGETALPPLRAMRSA